MNSDEFVACKKFQRNIFKILVKFYWLEMNVVEILKNFTHILNVVLINVYRKFVIT